MSTAAQRKRRAATERARQNARRALGLCPKCGTPPTSGKRCTRCQEEARLESKLRAERREAAGACARCKAPRSRGTRCERCASRDNARQRWEAR